MIARSLVSVLVVLAITVRTVSGWYYLPKKLHCGPRIQVILSDVGLPLRHCENCVQGSKFPDAVVAKATTPFDMWQICYWQPNGKTVLKEFDSGKYLARCTNCFAQNTTYPDSAFLIEDSSLAAAQWTMKTIKKLPDRKIVSLQADNGQYLARCRGCVSGYGNIDFLFVHKPTAAVSYAQFQVLGKEE